MEQIFEEVPCRNSQITELFNLLGEYGDPLPNSIFISGDTATGKTLCVETVLRYLTYKHVFINCVECYSLKIMCDMIFTSLLNKNIDETASYKCDTLEDLIYHLNDLQDVNRSYDPVVIILDKAERLRAMDSSVMPTFLRLREFCAINICTIFITDLIFDNFHFKTGVRIPTKIYFPNYNQDELLKILLLQQKCFVRSVTMDYREFEVSKVIENPEVFRNFLTGFLSIFYRPCRDLIELQYMAQVNFANYCEPILKGDVKAHDISKLWHNIVPILKSSLDLLYIRIKTNDTSVKDKENEWGEIMQEHPNTKIDNTLKEELISTKTFAQCLELPYYTKYLLIAAYLASYNPPKEDKRLFMKNHGKQRKRLQQVKAKIKLAEKLNSQLGPKVYTLDRWLAIYYAILKERIGLTSGLLSQIGALLELKLIAGTKEIELDCAKYKCIVGFEFISAVARTVGFSLRTYLYDLM